MAYRDKVHPLRTHGKNRFAATGIFPYTKPSVAMTGTAIAGGVLEAEIVSGGETIILTLTQGVWNKNTAAFNAARQAMINGMDSAQAEAAGWDAVVKAEEAVSAVVRTSDTVVTITLSDFDGAPNSAYVITADETITVTIPAALMEGQLEPLVAGTFDVTNA
ncbi:hypothetical protein LCGC14_3130720 [marine sediment metagenome]|uniref:Uncharacterized protein n=1 Tax=marine sediment metagenome TaxID=412755 RepID=A0A0F8VZT9_9ZZZZ